MRLRSLTYLEKGVFNKASIPCLKSRLAFSTTMVLNHPHAFRPALSWVIYTLDAVGMAFLLRSALPTLALMGKQQKGKDFSLRALAEQLTEGVIH